MVRCYNAHMCAMAGRIAVDGMQIRSIANLFGVKAQPSTNADRFHERWCLTELVRLPEAGILTPHGDLLVYA